MKIAVIGSGFAGMSAAAYLAKSGNEVHLFETHNQPGGRARSFEDNGFMFDMGPSWYWMPEVFEDFFKDFDLPISELYHLERLDPSYRIFFEDSQLDVPAGVDAFLTMAEKLDPGSSAKVKAFLIEAEEKYQISMSGFVQKPSLSIMEFASPKYLSKALKLNMFKSFSDYLDNITKEKKLRSILEFPVLFLGETPQRIPALYSIMNHADINLGTWYPQGGMKKVVGAFYSACQKMGVQFHFNSSVDSIQIQNHKTKGLIVNGEKLDFDVIVSGADYAHTEQLLNASERQYDDKYWKSKSFAPSCLIYYLGVNKKISGLEHHNLFFDTDFDEHAQEIYETHEWPKNPLFYVCCPSKTDEHVAPEGQENLFVLIPVSTRIEDTPEIREKYFNMVMNRMENHLGVSVADSIVVRHDYARSNFIQDYHAYDGNAYGLANTLMQTAFLKPKMKSTKVGNLYFTGQLTVPGPGVPPSIISGQTVAKLIQSDFNKK